MTKARLIAQRNHNGKVVVEVEFSGSKMSVPKKRNIADEALLELNGKTVDMEKGENGIIQTIKYNDQILYQHGQVQNNAQAAIPATAPAAASANESRQQSRQSRTQQLAQLRAGHALAQIEAMKAQDDGHLSAHIAGFPAMILMSGFGQACAFYLSKGKTMKLAYDALENWLTSAGRPYASATGTCKLMTAITSNNAATYRLAQAEALAYLDWLKKFAKAFLKSEEENGKEGERC
jgi:CRISPR-associated protein Cmr5